MRFAPSPTGTLHLGGLRTALFNYLYARANGGTFILRIEDTDSARTVPGAAAGLIRMLRWCGLDYDEGPELPVDGGTANDANLSPESFSSRGTHGPYVQSQRLPRYVSAAAELIESGGAYRCFCTAERLTALRAAQSAAGVVQQAYDRKCAKLPEAVARARAAAGEPHIVRLLVPSSAPVGVAGSCSTTIAVPDAVLGRVSFSLAGVDDAVLLKSDGFPTYHLASVVDDHAMAVSHVIRGQEWLSSTPKHLLLHAALGWAPPAYAHLPLLLNPDRTKLSKRAGGAAVEDYAAAGYLPEALLNFVAFLGWSPPLAPAGAAASAAAASEVLELASMAKAFSLDRLHKGNAIVDVARLNFFNAQHLRRQLAAGAPDATAALSRPKGTPAPVTLVGGPGLDRLRADVLPRLAARLRALAPALSPPPPLPPTSLNALLIAQHERVHIAADFVELLVPFALGAAGGAHHTAWMARAEPARTAAVGRLLAAWGRPADAGDAGLAALLAAGEPAAAAAAAVGDAWQCLSDAAFGEHPAAVDACKRAASAHAVAPTPLLKLVRYLTTGADVGASLSDTLRLLGRAESVARLRTALPSKISAQ